jgi:Na+-driven multidrug efflux pump
MAKVVYVSGAISIGVATVCTVASLFFAAPLSSIFVHDAESIDRAEEFLRILCVGAPFSAVAYTVISFFQAVGKPWKSLILALLRKGILDIPLMYIFFLIAGRNVEFGPALVVMATPIADGVACIASIVLFVRYLKKNGQNRGQFAEAKPAEKAS